MELPKQTCCLCLNISSISFINLFKKDEENVNYFEKLSSTLTELSNVLEEIGIDCLVCKNCCDSIEMVYKFNLSSLANAKLYSSQQRTIKEEEFGDFDDPGSPGNVSTSSREENFEIKKEDDPQNVLEICKVEIVDSKENGKLSFFENNENHRRSSKKLRRRKKDLAEDLEVVKIKKKRGPKKKIGEKKKHICEICQKVFKESSDLKRHEMIHTGLKPYMCEQCGKAFNRKKHLNDHMLTHSGEKPHTCDICTKPFRHKCALDRHKMIHFGEKPYSCDLCDRNFTQNIALIKHRRTHTGERPYKCQVCQKAFAQKVTLDGHRSVHTGEKAYSCDICHKNFTQKSTLSKHKKKFHKNLVTPETPNLT